MPNWITNCVTIKGTKKQIAELKLKLESEETVFDFNEIVPQPADLYTGDLGEAEYKKYGKHNWYDWSIENWGTKWNSYDAYLDSESDTELVYYFDTAWSAPLPVLKQLAKIYKVEVNLFFYDEDFGHNCGEFCFKNSKLVKDIYYENNGTEFLKQHGINEPDSDEEYM